MAVCAPGTTPHPLRGSSPQGEPHTASPQKNPHKAGNTHVSSLFSICPAAYRPGGAGCAAVPQLSAAAAAATGARVAGAVLRPASAADGAAGLHQPRPAGPGHRVCGASCHLLLHRHRHFAAYAPGGRHAAAYLAYSLAGRHNAVAADRVHHVVGPPPCPDAVYNKI